VQLSSEVFAAKRAEWLAELFGALRDAHHVLRELDVSDARVEAMELCAQIDALSREVSALQLRRNSRDSGDFDPEWIKSPWHSGNAAEVPKPASRSFGTGSGSAGRSPRSPHVPLGNSPPPENGSRNGSSSGGFHPDVATNARFKNARLP
jgi:hypothetical protein